MSDTASIAASVIKEAAESASTSDAPAAPESSNARDHHDIAIQEMDALSADDAGSLTRRTAAAMQTYFDERPLVSTRYGQVRRKFNDDGNATRRAAREMIDQAAWAEGQEDRPHAEANRRAMRVHDFAAELNGSPKPSAGAMPSDFGTEAYREAADRILDAIVKRGRDAK